MPPETSPWSTSSETFDQGVSPTQPPKGSLIIKKWHFCAVWWMTIELAGLIKTEDSSHQEHWRQGKQPLWFRVWTRPEMQGLRASAWFPGHLRLCCSTSSKSFHKDILWLNPFGSLFTASGVGMFQSITSPANLAASNSKSENYKALSLCTWTESLLEGGHCGSGPPAQNLYVPQTRTNVSRSVPVWYRSQLRKAIFPQAQIALEMRTSLSFTKEIAEVLFTFPFNEKFLAELGLLLLMSRKPGWDRFHLIKDICDEVVFLNTSHGTPNRDNGGKGFLQNASHLLCFGVYFRWEESHPGPDLHIKVAEETKYDAEIVPVL